MANPKAKQRSKKEAYIEAEELLEQRQVSSSRKSRFNKAELERCGIILNQKQL